MAMILTLKKKKKNSCVEKWYPAFPMNRKILYLRYYPYMT